MTLDRINVQGHYEPLNCRWATDDDQYRNKQLHLVPDPNTGKKPGVEDYMAMEKRLEEELGLPF